MHGGPLKQSQLLRKVHGHAMLIFFPKFRTSISLFESLIHLVPAKLWNFLEARILYIKYIENN